MLTQRCHFERETHTPATYQNPLKQNVKFTKYGAICFSFPNTNKICHFRFLIIKNIVYHQGLDKGSNRQFLVTPIVRGCLTL